MEEKNTSDLMNELSQTNKNLEDYMTDNQEKFININLKNFWNDFIEKSGMSNADIINSADFGYTYFYDVKNGKKIPSRDKILRLAIATHCTIDECQYALKYCGKSQLYPRVKRDSIIIYGISRSLNVFQICNLLIQSGEDELK